MRTIGITTYAIGVQNAGSGEDANQNYELNSFENNGFISTFKNFINQNIKQYETHEDLEKIFKFEDCKDDTYRDNKIPMFKYIFGKIKTGSYGLEAEIIDSLTGSVNYNKNMNDAEVMPFFFLIAIPTGDKTRGVVVLQTNGIYGIKKLFEKIVGDYLKSVNLNYRLILGNIAPKAYIERHLTEGILQKIRFIRYNIPNDRCNVLGINNGVEESYEEYTVHKPLGLIGKFGDNIRQVVRGQRLVNNIIQIGDFDYDNVKLEFKLGRKIKTINLNNIDKLVLAEDITDSVDLIGGHPTTGSIEPIMVETSAGYLEEMGLIIRE